MKRLTAGLLVLTLLWVLCACGKVDNSPAVTTSGLTTNATTETTSAPSSGPTEPPVTEVRYPHETEDAVVLENDTFRISISKLDCTVMEFYNKVEEQDIHTGNEIYFSYLVTRDWTFYLPLSLYLDENNLVVTYENDYQAEIAIEIFDFGFTAELLTSISDDIMRVKFCDLEINSEYTQEPDSWRISAIAMNTNTNPWNYPGEETVVWGLTYPEVADSAGAKLGVVFCTLENHKDSLIALCDMIDPAVGLVSSKGGAYSQEAEELYWDMVIADHVTADSATGMAKLASMYDIDSINFHQGSDTFIQGSFNFISALTQEELDAGAFGTAAMFKERIGNQILAEGVHLGLHTYSSLVDPAAAEILSDPKWQQDLVVMETFTLKEALSAGSSLIHTVEDASGYVLDYSLIPWNGCATAYFLIDSEIVLVYSGDETGFTYVERGQLGTEAAEHSAGAEMKRLGGIFGMFQPVPGSDLFYYVAQKIAEAYNDGGFFFIELDGLESMLSFSDEELWYYYLAEFVHEILLHCDETPMIDYSCAWPSIWTGRGREGATDTPFRSYKDFVLSHIAYNKIMQRGMLAGTLGWMSFAPDAYEPYKNCVYKTLFLDDIDFLGAKAIAYNQSMIYLDFNEFCLNGETNHARNFTYYSLYSQLRKEGYFTEEVKEILREGEYEYKLEQTENGYGFREMQYSSFKVYALDRATGCGNNPFATQKPYIRVEGRYSAVGDNELTVLKLDETADISTLAGFYELEPMDLSGHMAFRVRVYGNGQPDAAAVFSLYSLVHTEPGRLDFVVPLDHIGWKEYVLIDSDSGDYGEYEDAYTLVLPVEQIDYETYRGFVEMEYINGVNVLLVGNCEGALLDDLRACEITDGAVKNPSVTIGDRMITFETELRGGEYIEFNPATGLATHYYYEGNKACSREIAYTGSITVQQGKFAYVYSAESLTNAPVRARVVIGFQGDLIENP